jgi:hypothetical protein
MSDRNIKTCKGSVISRYALFLNVCVVYSTSTAVPFAVSIMNGRLQRLGRAPVVAEFQLFVQCLEGLRTTTNTCLCIGTSQMAAAFVPTLRRSHVTTDERSVSLSRGALRRRCGSAWRQKLPSLLVLHYLHIYTIFCLRPYMCFSRL